MAGAFDWQPYDAPKAPGDWARPDAPRRHSGLGIASFVLALAVGFGEFVLVGIAGFMELNTPGGIDEESPVAILLGLLLFGGLAVAFVGLVLGIAGIIQGNRKHVFGILGVIFNGLILLGVLGLMVLGMMSE